MAVKINETLGKRIGKGSKIRYVIVMNNIHLHSIKGDLRCL